MSAIMRTGIHAGAWWQAFGALPERELYFFNPLMWLALTMFIVCQTGKPGSVERGGRKEEGKKKEKLPPHTHSCILILPPSPSDLWFIWGVGLYYHIAHRGLFLWYFKNMLTYLSLWNGPSTALVTWLQEFLLSVETFQLGLEDASFENCWEMTVYLGNDLMGN